METSDRIESRKRLTRKKVERGGGDKEKKLFCIQTVNYGCCVFENESHTNERLIY